ncbi:MAG: N-acetylmuramoyl-L-alanine amidase [Firmicutes bacterium]|nr:N-acetylmuramoyl-L-alanine amidase [Bacillota bacterium]MBQ9603992.1 N-acetylmuramoyl-L-alanine amidase [Bacillota bacterium]
MIIKQMLLVPNPYSRPQTALKSVKKIAVHYIGNAGTSAAANRNYFNNLAQTRATYASSHYIIGLEGEIIQCVPENEIAYCTNSANSYSISIENCHEHADGKFNAKTLASLTVLCAHLCEKYDLDPLKDIIRHYDVTGKRCPLWWVVHPEEFAEFKRSVKEKMRKEVLDMDEAKRLSNRMDELEKAFENSREKVFKSESDVPAWGKATVEKLVKKGCLKGSENDLDLTYTLLRLLVINDRAGLYD